MPLVMRFNIILLAIYTCCTACYQSTIYEKNEPISITGWKSDDTLVFPVEIKDISIPYNISINVRHRDVFDFMNCYINILTILPNNQSKSEIISLPLSDEGGTWLGSCTGDICFCRVNIMKKVRFEQAGLYTFRINQEMRLQSVKNISDIGLRIEPTPTKKIKEDED